MQPSAKTIVEQGLWSNNTGLVQLLGLCPLLAVSTNAVNALGLGLATLLALSLTSFTIACVRRVTRHEVRIPMFVLIIASVVSVVELLIKAYFHELYLVLGIFIPLIVTNCAVLGRAEAFASRTDPARAALDGAAIGLGFLVVLLAIGAMRELVGQGSLFAQAELMLGPMGAALELRPLPDYRGFLPALLPPGAFVALALLIAIKNKIDMRAARRRAAAAPSAAAAAA